MNAPAVLQRSPSLIDRYREVRSASAALASPLSAEDCQIQSMADVSPTKWHLAHTSWFFETFLLVPYLPGYAPFDPSFCALFNSYYDSVGDQYPRSRRGILSRPNLDTIHAYRKHVDVAVERLWVQTEARSWVEVLELGLHHEQQHQELILMDIQHVLSCNPAEPRYGESIDLPASAGEYEWIDHPGGLCEIGHDGGSFAFDNESPRHRVWIDPFSIANRLVTAAEYQQFIADGGYRRPELWLAEGWAALQAESWTAPLYWQAGPEGWTRFSLSGRRPIDPSEPVLHVSFYEADAYARWSRHRLPGEAEWEVSASLPGSTDRFGVAWQWTASPYGPYSGYARASGAFGEYNGKFMINQMVLRGSSFATPPGHSRPTYRNFFPPTARWCFSGIRLAKDGQDPEALPTPGSEST